MDNIVFLAPFSLGTKCVQQVHTTTNNLRPFIHSLHSFTRKNDSIAKLPTAFAKTYTTTHTDLYPTKKRFLTDRLSRLYTQSTRLITITTIYI